MYKTKDDNNFVNKINNAALVFPVEFNYWIENGKFDHGPASIPALLKDTSLGYTVVYTLLINFNFIYVKLMENISEMEKSYSSSFSLSLSLSKMASN